jgi:hypothetical protein
MSTSIIGASVSVRGKAPAREANVIIRCAALRGSPQPKRLVGIA